MTPICPSSSAGIEVTVELEDGSRRWCFFMTPEALRTCGDWIDGSQIPFHYGAEHMIVVGTGNLDEDLIERALRYIDCRGDPETCTRPLSR